MARLRALLLTCLLASALVALALGLRGPYARYAAAHWAAQLATAEAADVEPLLRRIAALQGDGIAALTGALGSPRETVARAAAHVLADELWHWQQAGLRAMPLQRALAQALAARMPLYDAKARDDAASLAQQMLRLAPEAAVADRGSLIADCESILRIAAERRAILAGASSLPVTLAHEPLPSPRTSSIADAARQQEEIAAMLSKLPELPGGGPDLDPTRDADLWAAQDAEPSPPIGRERPAMQMPTAAGDAVDFEPQRLPRTDVPLHWREIGRVPPGAGGAVRPLSLTTEPTESNTARADAAAEPTTASADPVSQVGAASVDSNAGDAALDDGAAGADRPANEYAGVSETDLLRWLHDADAARADAAMVELKRRGFGEVECQLARLVCDPNPATRLELARTLPSLQSIDTKRWLLRLCDDRDAEVRLTAIGLAATAADPELVREAERRARIDADPRVQRFAEKLSQRRSAR